MIEVTTLMTAIQAGVRLYGATSKAFSIATTSQEIELPLPAAGEELTVTNAFSFFNGDEGEITRKQMPSEALKALLAEGRQEV
jgi:hypothetical protein